MAAAPGRQNDRRTGDPPIRDRRDGSGGGGGGPGVLRPGQLDAVLLDGELAAVLQERLAAVAESILPPYLMSSIEPETAALARWLASESLILSAGASYGMQMHNLRYRYEPEHRGRHELSAYAAPVPTLIRYAHAILGIGIPLIWTRLKRSMTQLGWGDGYAGQLRTSIYNAIHWIDIASKIAWIANFLVFIVNGKYRSILDRLLGMRIVFDQPTMSRAVNFEFMNRQLVWSTVTDFLLFMIPYMNIPALRRTITRSLRITHPRMDLPEHLCAICHTHNRPKTTLELPHMSNCGHVFCYYCVRCEMAADPSFPCPRCGVTIRKLTRVGSK